MHRICGCERGSPLKSAQTLETLQGHRRLRTGVERYFSRLGPREVEDTTLFNYRSVRNQMTIAHLTLNLVAVAAAIVLQQPDKTRCYKTFADDLAA